MSLWINDEELEAMEGLRDVLIRLYIFGIRKYMDGQSCITGIKRGISYKSLGEQLFEEPELGFKTRQQFSIQQARRAVKALEKKGLIKIQSEGKRLILKCVLAPQGKSVQNKADSKPTRQADSKADTFEPLLNPINTDEFEQLEKIPDIEADIPQTGKADTPLLSIYTNKTKPNTAKRNSKITFPDDFCVTDAHRAYAQEKNLPSPDTEFEKFRDHHLANGSLFSDWNAAFRNWLRKAKDLQQEKAHAETRRPLKNNAASTNATRPKSKTDALWEECAPGAFAGTIFESKYPKKLDR